jgi:hypothetical protein
MKEGKIVGSEKEISENNVFLQVWHLSLAGLWAESLWIIQSILPRKDIVNLLEKIAHLQISHRTNDKVANRVEYFAFCVLISLLSEIGIPGNRPWDRHLWAKAL